MKQILKYFLFSFAFLIPSLAQAQTREVEGTPGVYEGYHGVNTGVATGKKVTPNSTGSYTITLETFATGSSITTMKSIPSDIVLVLDYSSSMLMNGSGGDPRSYLYELKSAVGTFVNKIKENNATLELKDGEVGNRIAFIIYAGLVYDEFDDVDPTRTNLNGISGEGNNGQLSHYRFYAKHLNKFINVDDLTVATKSETHPLNGNSYTSASVTYSGVDILSPASQRAYSVPGYQGIPSSTPMGDLNKGTHSQYALERAEGIVSANIATYDEGDRVTTVVFFTDGEPSAQYQGTGNFSQSYATGAIAAAKDIKDNGVPVFSVGLFSSPSAQIKTFVEYVSSDFPEATTMPTSGYLNPNGNYGKYCKIVSGGVALDDVFKTIAESSGGSTEKVPAESQVVDVVSNSFNIPSGFNASSVQAYTVNANADGETWDEEHPTTLTVVTTGTAYLTDPSMVKLTRNGSSITVDGFDYGKADTNTTGTPDGNWVGWRERTSGNVFGGKKLVIKFDIDPDPNATGGAETNTNAAGSGVKIPVYADDGVTITGWRMVNDFLPPHTTLPVYLVIQKDGLKYGESATFEVKRIRPKGWVAGKTDEELEALLEYNETTGKPLPGDGTWETWTKVILTQKDPNSTGQNRQIVSKELVALDPYWVYSIEEDDWGWAYEYEVEVINTSDKEKNPFTFVNTDKVDAVKHAEAVMINHFKLGSDGKAEVEHYKSGKLEAF